jgi:alpha/beta superfamily hydrolase
MTSIVAPPLPGPTSAPARLRGVDLLGPQGRLEAILNEGGSDAPCAVLLCHPHPLAGGTLHNKVVYHAMKALNDPAWGLNWPVLRFNFRGAGLSQGAHDGLDESADVLAALDWLHHQFQRPLVAIGFSFGAAMIVRACCPPAAPLTDPAHNVCALAALGLPTSIEGRQFSYAALASSSIPKLFLSGDQDAFAPAPQLAQVAESAAHPRRLLLLPGADHFFTGHLQAMQAALADWCQELVL